MKYPNTNTLDRVPSRASPPDWLAVEKKIDIDAALEREAIQAVEREAEDLLRFADLLAAGVSLMDRCPPGTVLYADGRVEFPR